LSQAVVRRLQEIGLAERAELRYADFAARVAAGKAGAVVAETNISIFWR